MLVDFGKVAFGNLALTPPAGATGTVTVRFGEALRVGRVHRTPPGSVRYAEVVVKPDAGKSMVVAPQTDKRNTQQPAAILTPPEWGVVLPFRWVEIEGWSGKLEASQIQRRSAFASDWSDGESSFHCSYATLDRIWELCRYSIKATTFAGVYVDGDRERIPYEADAYLNQLSHYATSNDVQMARDTFDRLMAHPTWPTEWAPHMVFMAHADWMQTGDAAWLKPRYEALKQKTLANRAGPDGLVTSNKAQMQRDDIVDWPTGERDGYQFTKVNTVVNAFHQQALLKMMLLARAVGNETDVRDYGSAAAGAEKIIAEQMFDGTRGLFRDGIGTDHVSLHANLFPLAFGLVPLERRAGVTRWLASRGMACSVYGAQYLLEGLFENGADREALALITAPGDRSWKHMLDSGSTITWEAWDQKYKPNLDWNHAWGAAPANLLPRYVLGAKPLVAGWREALIRPHPGDLKFAEGKVPTPLGPVQIAWKNETPFSLDLTLPKGMTATVDLPAAEGSSSVLVGGQPVKARYEGGRWILENPVSGELRIEVR